LLPSLAAAVELAPSPDLSLRLDAAGDCSGLDLAERPRRLVGAGGWLVSDLALGGDETVWCPLPAAADRDPDQGYAPSEPSLADLLRPPDPNNPNPPPPQWRWGPSWRPAGSCTLPDSDPAIAGRVLACALPTRGSAGPLRLIWQAAAAARTRAAFTVTVWLRGSDFQGRLRLGLLPVNAFGQATGAWIPFDEPAAPLGAAWSARHCEVLPPLATAGLVLYLAPEDASGRVECAGARLTLHSVAPAQPLTGALTATAAGAHFAAAGDGLALTADYRLEGGAVRLHAELAATDGRRRALYLIYALPLDGAGWEWWDSPRRHQPIPPGGQRGMGDWWHLGGGHQYSAYPLGCISTDWPAGGLALAAPLRQPLLTRFGYAQRLGLFALFDLGLAPDAGHPGVAIDLACYPVDGHWGLRDGLRRYYQLFPDDVGGGYPRPGAWFTAADPSAIGRDPQHYGLQFDERAAGHAEWARNHHLTGLAPLAPWGVTLGTEGHDPPPAARLRDAGGSPVSWVTPDGATYTPQCTLPDLGPDSPGAAAQAALASALGSGSETLAGVALAGVAARATGWEVDDYDPAHWKLAAGPLAAGRATRGPVLPAAVEHLALLADLAARHHPPEGLVLGGPEPATPLPFVLPYLHALTAGETCPPLEHLRWLRALGPHKPITFLDPAVIDPQASPERRRAVWQEAILLGAFPGAAGWYDAGDLKQLDSTFALAVPILRRLAAAGWEPLAAAEVNDLEIELERYGQGQQLALVLLNPTGRERTVTLTLDPLALGLVTREPGGLERRRLEFEDLLDPAREHPRFAIAFDRWQAGLTLRAGEMTVLAPAAESAEPPLLPLPGA
jgi:hypothetical protein